MEKQEIDTLFYENHLTHEACALYAEAMMVDLEDTLPRAIREHVGHCFQCKKEVFAAYDINNTAPNASNEGHVKTNTHLNVQHIWISRAFKIAASFILLAGLGALLYDATHNKTVTQQKIAAEKKIEVLPTNNRIAENKPISHDTNTLTKGKEAENTGELEVLEGLIGSHYRNADIKTISPKLNQRLKVGKPIVFEFSPELSEPCSIKVFDHNGVKIVETEKFTSGSFTLHKKLLPGLYYWKLEKDDDLITVSKFIVTE
jgi:hypothetical protein